MLKKNLLKQRKNTAEFFTLDKDRDFLVLPALRPALSLYYGAGKFHPADHTHELRAG